MGVEKLQGTPWHSETMHRTCKDGSKYCLYIHDDETCGCIASINHKKKCIGKGSCEDFESKGESLIPATKKKNIVSTYHPERTKKIEKVIKEQNEKKAKREMDNKKTERINEKKENFLRLSQDRVNKIIKDIESLEKLSNRNNYSYTDQQIEKMFNAISNQLQESKKSFENKKSSGKFEW